jgi:hypothetical protein
MVPALAAINRADMTCEEMLWGKFGICFLVMKLEVKKFGGKKSASSSQTEYEQ